MDTINTKTPIENMSKEDIALMQFAGYAYDRQTKTWFYKY